MSDEDTTFTAPVAAIPSRASPIPTPMFEEPLRRGKTGDILKPRPRAKAKKAVAKRKKAPVPNRKKAVRSAAVQRRNKRVVRTAKPAPAKNPNRPLEAKNKLQAVLRAMVTLNKREGTVFGASMQMLDAITRSERKRVIGALSQVYG